jgi:hypothetical protein
MKLAGIAHHQNNKDYFPSTSIRQLDPMIMPLQQPLSLPGVIHQGSDESNSSALMMIDRELVIEDENNALPSHLIKGERMIIGDYTGKSIP